MSIVEHGDKPSVVIVGGVAGGASAAARLRRRLEHASITVFERGPHASFANCGLPYYLGGEIVERSKLLVAGKTQLEGWLRLDLHTGEEVVSIDRVKKTVTARSMATGDTADHPYDFLVLAPGAAPIRPPALLSKVGADHPRVLSLRNLPDVDRIKAVVDGSIRRAVVIGGGFIGLEVAEQLHRRDVAVTLVEMLPQVLPPFDPEMTAPIVEELARRGVTLALGDGVKELEPREGGQVAVRLASGAEHVGDLVLLAIGVRPETELARAAGLDLNERGAIRVDGWMRTSDPHILAVGDAVEVDDPILGGRAQIPLAGPANRQGRLAADHIADRVRGASAVSGRPYRGSQGTSIVRVFDIAAAMTGASEKSLQRAGLKRHEDYGVVVVHPFHHASYYPGAKRLSLKLLFARPDGRILGAQAVGAAGVDKRIDVIAMAIQMRATVFDLEQAELCYSPQFGSAKDAVNLAAFQAANALRGQTNVVTADELAAQLAVGATTALDVRTESEFNNGHVPGALWIPLDQLRDRLAELPADASLTTYCQVGMRGYIAEGILRQHGFTAVGNLAGGYTSWRMRAAN